LSWLFRDAGFDVMEAGSGAEALRLVGHKPDLVVLDVSLPDINGIEVCRRIKSDPATRSVPVLHVSAVYVASGDRSHGLEAGADAYLIKPVEPRELLATVRALLRIHEAEEKARGAAQEWRTTFDAIGDAVCLVDAAGNIVRCNQAMSRLLGQPFTDLIGQPYAQKLPQGLGLSELPAVYRDCLKPGPADRAGEGNASPSTVREAALGERWYRISITPHAGPPAFGSVHVLTDITEHKQLEEQLRQAQKLEAVGQLAGGVAHDFNNLLTAILGNASLLAQRVPPRESELVSTIERAAWRAAELTRQLLGFSRKTMLWLRPTCLNEPVKEVVTILQRTVDPRILLDSRTAPDLWLVQADAGQMSQVLMNLCLNACDAMPDGGFLTLETANVNLTESQVQGHLDARPGSFVRLSVSDTGRGIAPEHLPRIWEPFFTTKPPGKGTGLGLPMVFGIVKQHDGWIECRSEPGHGTRFDLYVPRLKAPAPAPEAAPVPVEPMARGAGTILLADDNEMLRKLAATLLQKNGFRVLVAEDGQEAVEIFERERSPIDLVILDLMMPRLSGQDAFHRLKEIDPTVGVIFASGFSDVQLEEADRSAALGFLDKPYREADMMRAVHAAFERRGAVSSGTS
jgi:two-component system cell cycle sensor histidine kinase/response regulator CckA